MYKRNIITLANYDFVVNKSKNPNSNIGKENERKKC
jgi:hypothetical protein